MKYYQTIAKNASTVAILRTTPQTQLPRILEHEVAAQEEAPTDIPKENNNSDDEETPNVFEAWLNDILVYSNKKLWLEKYLSRNNIFVLGLLGSNFFTIVSKCTLL